MKKNYILFYTLFFTLASAFAQSPLVKKWDKAFGGTSAEFVSSMHQTRDGGYVLGGTSHSDFNGNKSHALIGVWDYWIVKIDSLGNKQWDKDFGGTTNNFFTCMQQTADGGYILGGYSDGGIGGSKTQASRGNYDYWIVKTDSLGNKQWDKNFGGTDKDYLFCLQQTTDRGYMLGGYSRSGISGDKTEALKGTEDYWIVKIDSLGNKQWDKDFGGAGTQDLLTLQQSLDGGYILGGYSDSGIGGDKSQATRGAQDYWIVKTDSLGVKQWDKDFGGTDYDYLRSLVQTADGGYILAGESYSGIGGDKTKASKGGGDYWLIKVDSLGGKQWDKVYGGSGGEEALGNISLTHDGGYLFAGTSYSPISGDKTENNLGPEQTWVIKLDSIGNRQWDKTLHTNSNLDDEDGFAVQTNDGCYVMANETYGGFGGDKTQSSQGAYDYWIIKFCDTTKVVVIPPHSNFLASDTVLCSNDCITFTNQSNNATSYQWFFTGGSPASSTAQNPYVCYLAGGNYDVKLIALNGSAKDSLTLSSYIHVKAAPTAPVISQTGNTLYFNNDPSYTSYQWYDSTWLIPGATDTFLVVNHDGAYSVRVKNANGCETATGLTVILGITTLSKNTEFFIFPNPLTYSSILQFNKQLKDAEVVICDMVGKEVVRRKVTGSRMEMKSLASGVYFVSVWENERRYVQKIVVE